MSQESRGNTTLVIDQERYENSLRTRSDHANDHPLLSVFRTDNDWLRKYDDAIRLSEERSQSDGICDHSVEHVSRVALNALYLADLAIESVGQSGSRLSPQSDWENTLSSSNLLFAAKLHDVGYGDPNAEVIERNVLGHERLSFRMIEQFARSPGIGSSDAHKYIYDYYNLFSSAIPINIEEGVSLARQLDRQKEKVTAQQLFPLLFKAADMLDLYFRPRVDFLSPEDNQNNKYFDLAYAVEKYGLYSHHRDNDLTYAVALDTYAGSSTQEVLSSDNNLTRWRNDASVGAYAKAWELHRIFAEIIGKNFSIVGTEKYMMKHPELLAKLGSSAIVHS
jgi:hypothetical protein